MENENHKICKVCKPGFYLGNSKNCIKNPDIKILHCGTHGSLTKCLQCVLGYKLASNQLSCIKQVAVAKCVSYNRGLASNGFNSGDCTSCGDGNYLSQNTCIARSVSLEIANCAKKAVSADRCEECDATYFLNADGTSCYK